MPSKHIWVREKDEALWDAIPNKAEWLHRHLNQEIPVIKMQTDKFIKFSKADNTGSITTEPFEPSA